MQVQRGAAACWWAVAHGGCKYCKVTMKKQLQLIFIYELTGWNDHNNTSTTSTLHQHYINNTERDELLKNCGWICILKSLNWFDLSLCIHPAVLVKFLHHFFNQWFSFFLCLCFPTFSNIKILLTFLSFFLLEPKSYLSSLSSNKKKYEHFYEN